MTVNHIAILINKLYFASSTWVNAACCLWVGGAGGPLAEVTQTGEHGFARTDWKVNENE